MLPVVVDGVVVLERVAALVLEEDARHVAQGERVVVAVALQLGTVQSLEMVLLIVDSFHQSVTTQSLVADLAVLHRVVVADHIDVEQVLDL